MPFLSSIINALIWNETITLYVQYIFHKVAILMVQTKNSLIWFTERGNILLPSRFMYLLGVMIFSERSEKYILTMKHCSKWKSGFPNYLANGNQICIQKYQ